MKYGTEKQRKIDGEYLEDAGHMVKIVDFHMAHATSEREFETTINVIMKKVIETALSYITVRR